MQFTIGSNSITTYDIRSSFVFSTESLLSRSQLSRRELPPGALISLVQKGLQCAEIEREIRNEDHHKQLENGGNEGKSSQRRKDSRSRDLKEFKPSKDAKEAKDSKDVNSLKDIRETKNNLNESK